MGTQPDPLGKIEDPTIRRFVRAIVHVRRFLPFYAGGGLFALAMLVVPVVGGGEGGTPPSLAGSGGGAGSVAGPASASAASRTSGATGVALGAGSSVGLASAPTFLDDAFDGTIDGPVASAGSAGLAAPVADRRTAADPVDAPQPDFSTPDGVTDPDVPAPCRLEPPSPAPAVDPTRELSGGQHTAEAVLGQQLPADAGETVAPVTDAALCNIPAAPVAVPSVPLPATPVSTDSTGGGSWTAGLSRLLDLLFLG